ncbi:MAG TPA: diacylglycerol kinase family protein [Candidatus Angelobacter sp.]
MKAVAFLGPSASDRSVEPFQDKNVDLQIESTQHLDSPQAALIFGGDGTVHRYLPQLYASKIPALVVPKGTGNDFAHAIGIHNEKIALRAWRQFCAGANNVREIDLGMIRQNDQEIPFCCVVGAGLDADANARANRLPSWLRSSAGYLFSAVQALFAFRPVHVRVSTEDRTENRKALLIAIGNAHRYGGGIKIVPQAQLDDGLLDVCLVGDISKLKVFFCLPIIYFGGHTGLKEVEYFRARTVRIESDPALDVYADGELACRTPVELSLLSKGLRVIVPPEGC